MAVPDLDNPEQRAAYRNELRRVGRPMRMAALVVTLIGIGLAVLSRNDKLPVGIPLFVIALGGVMTFIAMRQRTRYHRRRMAGR